MGPRPCKRNALSQQFVNEARRLSLLLGVRIVPFDPSMRDLRKLRGTPTLCLGVSNTLGDLLSNYITEQENK